MALHWNIIKVGSVREHGCRDEVRWKRGASRKDGMPQLFRGVGKESRKFSSSMRDKESFLATKEMMVRSFEVKVEGLRVGESITKVLDVESCICHCTICSRGKIQLFRGWKWNKWSEGSI